MTVWLRSLATLGPLLPAAERFLAREGAGELGRGASGLAWLARTIDRFAERDASPQEESSFVEGAGALLAAILIDHAGEGAHVARDGAHRIRIGPRGFLDPFSAIESALDADRAREALVRVAELAEREAKGSGGIGLAASRFDALLAARRPELEVSDRFERRVWIGGDVEIDLGRAIDASDGQGERALDQALLKLISMLPGGEGGGAIEPTEALARLLPRLVASDFPGEGLFGRPIANGVRLCLVLAYDGRSRFVREWEPESWGLSPDEAVRHAIGRLAGRSDRARFARTETAGGIVVAAQSRDGLDSARLLLPGLHDALAPELGSPFLAAIPHRDTLLACVRGAASREALAARARDEAMRAPHRICDALFEIDARGVRSA